MLLIKTKIGNSSIQGTGLFADEHIKKGQKLWEFIKGFDLHLPASKVEALPETPKSYIMRYAYKHSTLSTYVLCADDAIFLNHSDTPNIVDLHFDTEFDAYSVAARDISPGEELTVDYSKFDAKFDGTF